VGIDGVSGAGKTYTALMLAKMFGSKIALIDSEHSSASKYSSRRVDEPGKWKFDAANLEEKTIQEYRAKVHDAAVAGYEVLILDSLSHAWIAALEAVDKMGGSKFNNGWRTVSPMFTGLIDDLIAFPGHVIATMRSKSDYVLEQTEKGSTPKKVGMAAVMRDGIEYEFDVMLTVTKAGITASKTRCSALEGGAWNRDVAGVDKIGGKLKSWLQEGEGEQTAEETAVTTLMNKIRFAQNETALSALVPEIKALPNDADRKALAAPYLAKKKALTEAAPTPVEGQ
jgi:hypothetical protein